MKIPCLILTLLFALFSSCIREPEQLVNSKYGNFDALCSIIDTRYCYLNEKELDWDAIKKSYRKQLEDKNTKHEIFDHFAKLLAELKDGHVNLFSNFDVSRYDKWYSDSARNYYPELIFDKRSKYIKSKIRSAGSLRYAKLQTENIGYVYCGSFSAKLSNANLRSVIEYFKDCDAMIIDVRNNGGGSVSNSEKLAACFFEQKELTAYMRHKTGPGRDQFSERFPIYTFPATNPSLAWKKPVAVLSNRRSYSATNDFVCRMKCAPQAIVVGSWSGGGAGLPFSSELPNGWIIRFSASPLFDRNMNSIEGGVEPDFWTVIPDTQTRPPKDDVLDKAVEELLKM